MKTEPKKPVPAAKAGTKMANQASQQAVPMDDYQAQDDMRTLARAHEIKQDKKRHHAAREHAKKHLANLKAVARGHKSYNEQE